MTARQKCVKAAWQLLQEQTRSFSTFSSGSSKQQAVQWLHVFSQHSNAHSAGSSTGSSTGFSFLRFAKHQLQSSRSFAAGAGGPQQAAARTARAAPKAGAAGGTATKTAAGAAAGAAAKTAAGAAADAASTPLPPLSPYQRWRRAFAQIPTVPKWLGLTGAIPFIAFAPPVCKHLAPLLPTVVYENCAMVQVCYGVVIVTFLGAVHWGVALATPLTSRIAVRIANEAFVYSVIPSLCAWPVALMEPGAGAVVLSLLLPGCYLADLARRNLGLPAWYMTLRVPLTVLATFGMLLTATRHIHAELDRVKEADDSAQQEQPQAAA